MRRIIAFSHFTATNTPTLKRLLCAMQRCNVFLLLSSSYWGKVGQTTSLTPGRACTATARPLQVSVSAPSHHASHSCHHAVMLRLVMVSTSAPEALPLPRHMETRNWNKYRSNVLSWHSRPLEGKACNKIVRGRGTRHCSATTAVSIRFPSEPIPSGPKKRYGVNNHNTLSQHIFQELS